MTEREAMEIIMQVAYDGEFPNNSNEAFGVACRCIENQIPKEPYRISGIDSNDNAFVECPICKAGNETSIKTIKQIYCWKCGQAIKWE